ncbi:YwiC-like family protein [Micromonospora sp. C28SCA-DRY-2]|uniref:YwiC-like family protein n=1 Tax=Micromonospora sp. C28SCA-DRY-2 TaxID=3059522 RepID=UPI0026750930|nr:YwiC-like family protein [Micromonospora sp. C28SCA-DRY-2]MDO3700122.1 YwiC-like family protein [Micromonospora sp. C28SCA-DRY-2]
MSAATSTARPVGPRRRVRRFLPPQHGAWAMLLLPYTAGVALVGPRWPHLPLLGAWLAGYLLSYYAFQAIKTRRPRRFAEQLLVYGLVAAPLAVTVLLARPAVLWYAPGYAALLAVNAGYAWRRRERALLNDLASVAQSCLLVFVLATIAGVPLADVVPAFLALLLYLVGTVFYVKTMIRERGDAGYLRLSVGFHALALLAAAALDPLLAPVFLLLLIRAVVLPGRGLRPARVGVIEIGCSLLVLAVVLIAL